MVLITGSSSGIGRAIALSFARLGCRVVIHGTNKYNIDQVASECSIASPNNQTPFKVICDLRDDDQTRESMANVLSQLGCLDVLVNNAGLFKSSRIDSENAYQDYREMMKLNVDHVVLTTSLAIPHLKKSHGCIINISSNLHFKCLNGSFAYSASKAALTMLTKSIAVDLAPDIRVNSVSPGPVATSMPTRVGFSLEEFRQAVSSSCLVERIGEADEIARVVTFLASPESSFITGSDFVIDGGSSVKPSGKIMGEE